MNCYNIINSIDMGVECSDLQDGHPRQVISNKAADPLMEIVV